MEEIIFLTTMIQKFLDYNLVLAECRLHAQIKEAITHASIIGINERASILEGLANDLCTENNFLKTTAEAEIKNYKSSNQSNSSFSNHIECAQKKLKSQLDGLLSQVSDQVKTNSDADKDEDEDEDEDERDSKATIIDGCLDLYTEVVYDQLITQYINDLDNSNLKKSLYK